MREVVYLGDSLDILCHFPDRAKQRVLTLLDGLRYNVLPHPKEFKYMAGVGKGVYELRVRERLQYRVFYIAKSEGYLFVLHAFVKKTQKTSKNDLKIGRQRYKKLIENWRID